MNLRVTREALDQLTNDVASFSDPANLFSLPYPSLHGPQSDKFAIKRENNIPVFRFMGRAYFADVYAHYKAYTDDTSGSRRLVVYGPQGSGKTLCLSALACLLTRLGRYVIYVPSCYLLTLNFVGVIQDALYMALPSDLHSAVDTAKTPEALIELVGDFKEDDLVFILPEWDALFPRYASARENSSANSAQDWLTCMIRRHYSICSISASAANWSDVKSLEDSPNIFNIVGGFNDVSLFLCSADARYLLDATHRTKWISGGGTTQIPCRMGSQAMIRRRSNS